MIRFLKVTDYYNFKMSTLDIYNGEYDEGDLFSLVVDIDSPDKEKIFYVRDLDVDYEYLKKKLFSKGYNAKVYDGSKIEKDQFAVLCTKDKKYMIVFANGCQIRNFATLIPNVDLSKIDDDDDMAIVTSILKCQELGIKGVSIGSSAYNCWKYSTKEATKSTKSRFCDKFIDKNLLMTIRDSYKGSINIVAKGNEWLDEPTMTIDCNSLYPYWLLEGYIPYGKPLSMTYAEWELGRKNSCLSKMLTIEEYDGTKRKTKYNSQYKIAIVKCVLKGKIKNGHVPTFGTKDENGKYHYDDEIDGVFNIWNFELDEIEKHYEWEVFTKIDVLAFKVCSGEKFFGPFFQKFKKLKEDSKDDYLTRLLAKLMLNNLIGKFATKNELYVQLEVSEGKFEFVKSENYDYYVALTSFVNSKARAYMMSLINLFGDKFVYCDTDSITFIGSKIPQFMIVLMGMSEFGKFKIESKNKYFHLLKCKQYEKMTEKGLKRVISGCPQANLYDFEKFEKGTKFAINTVASDIKTGIPFIQSSYFQLG